MVTPSSLVRVAYSVLKFSFQSGWEYVVETRKPFSNSPTSSASRSSYFLGLVKWPRILSSSSWATFW